MKVLINADTLKVWISPKNTQNWALGLGPFSTMRIEPSSELAGRSLYAEFSGGWGEDASVSYKVDGRILSGNWVFIPEFHLGFCVADHLEQMLLDKKHKYYRAAVGRWLDTAE